MTTTRTDTIVIGAGPAGLATSSALSDRGVDHLVLERGRVGETWRTQRWDGFRLNSPEWMNRLPGAPSPARPDDGFATRDQHVADLEDYAARLPVLEAAPVVETRREGDGYVVRTPGRELRARHVVLASGVMNVPRVPALAGALPGRLHQLHTAQYRCPDALPAGGVLIVGGAQSGAQIAHELLAARRRVYLATSPVGRLPRRHRGRDVMRWLADTGFLRTPAEQVDPAARGGGQPVSSGAHGRATLSLQWLARRGARLLGRLEGCDGEHARIGGDLAENLALGDRSAAQIRADIDRHIAEHALRAPEHQPEAAERPLIGVRECRSLHLGAEGITTVIWATGFGGDFGYLRLPILDAGGVPHHAHGALAAPGLHAVGLWWLTSRTSAGMYGIAHDAVMVADRIAMGEGLARRAA
jgi:putative flavoprotein involved in K+ transport